MGIRVAHEPDIGTMVNLAYGTGQGVKNVREQERRDKFAMFNAQQQLQYNRLRLAENARREGIANEQTRYDRNLIEGRKDAVTAYGRTEQSKENDFGRELTAFDIEQQAKLEAEERQNQQANEQMLAKDRLDRDKTTWEYTQLQQKEKEKIDEGRNWLEQERASGRVTQPEYEQFKGQLDAREHGILPVRKYNNEPSPQEIMAQRTWVDPETGDKIYMEPGGRIHNLTADRKKIEDAAKIKQQESYAKAYIETFKALTTEDEFGGKKLPAPEQVTAVMKAMYPNMQPAQAEQPTQESPGLTEAIEAVQQIRENPDLQTPENIGTTYAKAIKEAYPDASPEEQRSMTEEAILTDFPDLGKDSGFEKEQTVKIEQPKPTIEQEALKTIAQNLSSDKVDTKKIAETNAVVKKQRNEEMWRKHEEDQLKAQEKRDKQKAYVDGLKKKAQDKAIVKTRDQLAKRLQGVTDEKKIDGIIEKFKKILADRMESIENNSMYKY